MINYISIMLDMCIPSKIFDIYAMYWELTLLRLLRCSIGQESDFRFLKTSIDIGTEADVF
jgi:hypothetical protein